MMKIFDAEETKDPKWKSLACCQKFRQFLQCLSELNGTDLFIRRLAVGVIVWTDGWDTSTGTKSNRSPMHTGTTTLVFVDASTGDVVGIAAYPIMGGPGKKDHATVFRRLQEDMARHESAGGDRRFESYHFW